MNKNRVASKPWELIVWIIASVFMICCGVYALIEDGFELFPLFLIGGSAWILISCIVALPESFKR